MKQNKKEIFWEYVKAIVTALLLALFIRAYFIQAFKIPSGSMLPTLMIGDHILVNKFIYGTKLPFSDKRILMLKKPAKGDIIVFKYPADPSRDFIKRVIGVEGDVIESRDKALFVNGLKVTEPYVQHVESDIMPRGPDCRYEPGILTGPNSQYCRDNFGPLTVPKETVFVMGDNRDQSYDSRFWRFVDMSLIKGEALIMYWSWDGKKHWPRLDRIGRLVK